MAIKKRQLFRRQNATVAKTRQLKAKENEPIALRARSFKLEWLFSFVTLLDAILRMDDNLYYGHSFERKSCCGASSFFYKSVTFDPLFNANK